MEGDVISPLQVNYLHALLTVGPSKSSPSAASWALVLPLREAEGPVCRKHAHLATPTSDWRRKWIQPGLG